MPRCLTSTARLAPKEEMKLFVAAYSAVKGEAMAAAALEVNTMQPRSFFCTCRHVPVARQQPSPCRINHSCFSVAGHVPDR